MGKNTERDDLVHILSETLSMEGYDVDSELERELLRLANFIITKNSFEDDEEADEGEFPEDDEDALELDPENLEWPDEDE
jgi:hypothetical protein